jgi:phosphoribosylanthranilate isomerase
MDSVIAKLEGSVFSMLESQEAPRIKICGLRRREDIEYANRLKPDFIGFVFDPSKRRYVDPDDAAALRAELSPAIKAVGVFVDAEISTIVKIASAGTIALIQLHGSEDNTYINGLRSKLHSRIPIIKAFKVEAAEDIENANSSSADYVLLDNGTGTGETFDWTLLDGAVINKPFFLAGGLGPDNVKEVIKKLHPDVVDVSPALETNEYKDYVKMKKFVCAVRSEGRTFVD